MSRIDVTPARVDIRATADQDLTFSVELRDESGTPIAWSGTVAARMLRRARRGGAAEDVLGVGAVEVSGAVASVTFDAADVSRLVSRPGRWVLSVDGVAWVDGEVVVLPQGDAGGVPTTGDVVVSLGSVSVAVTAIGGGGGGGSASFSTLADIAAIEGPSGPPDDGSWSIDHEAGLPAVQASFGFPPEPPLLPDLSTLGLDAVGSAADLSAVPGGGAGSSWRVVWDGDATTEGDGVETVTLGLRIETSAATSGTLQLAAGWPTGETCSGLLSVSLGAVPAGMEAVEQVSAPGIRQVVWSTVDAAPRMVDVTVTLTAADGGKFRPELADPTIEVVVISPSDSLLRWQSGTAEGTTGEVFAQGLDVMADAIVDWWELAREASATVAPEVAFESVDETGAPRIDALGSVWLGGDVVTRDVSGIPRLVIKEQHVPYIGSAAGTEVAWTDPTSDLVLNLSSWTANIGAHTDALWSFLVGLRSDSTWIGRNVTATLTTTTHDGEVQTIVRPIPAMGQYHAPTLMWANQDVFGPADGVSLAVVTFECTISAAPWLAGDSPSIWWVGQADASKVW